MLDGVQTIEHALHEHEAVILALIPVVAMLTHVLVDVLDGDVIMLGLREVCSLVLAKIVWLGIFEVIVSMLHNLSQGCLGDTSSRPSYEGRWHL